MSRSTHDRTHLEYLVLAESVENVDGKPRIIGGGWDTLIVHDISQPVMLALACGVKVPWLEADAEHVLTLSVGRASGPSVAPPHEETLRVGRSRLAGPDDPAHQPFTIRWEVIFPAYGRYALTATVDGRTEGARQVRFSVEPPPGAEPVISEEEMNIIDEELSAGWY